MIARRTGAWLAATLLILAGCSVAPAGSLPGDTAPPAATAGSQPPPPTTAPTVAPTTSPTAATDALDGPPAADLAAEGGDPVGGALGTYTWGERGSDAPWLPGTPARVGVGEPLSLTLRPDVQVRGWRVRAAPAATGSPDGARSLGEGSGPVSFEAPGPGTWTVEVRVDFGEGVGSAAYYWELDVR